MSPKGSLPADPIVFAELTRRAPHRAVFPVEEDGGDRVESDCCFSHGSAFQGSTLPEQLINKPAAAEVFRNVAAVGEHIIVAAARIFEALGKIGEPVEP